MFDLLITFISQRGWAPLHLVVRLACTVPSKTCIESVRLLLASGADPNLAIRCPGGLEFDNDSDEVWSIVVHVWFLIEIEKLIFFLACL
jgi:hypothetical protein